jgi:hypothetical protein
VVEHFGAEAPQVKLLPEKNLLDERSSPRSDFVAFLPGSRAAHGRLNLITIEVQAVGITGNVGQQYQFWAKGKSQEGLADTASANQVNSYSFLVTQIIQKGGFLRHIGVPNHVLLQEPNLSYLMDRIPFTPVPSDGDIIFTSVDLAAGDQLEVQRVVRADFSDFLESFGRRFVIAEPEQARQDYEDSVVSHAEKLGLYHDHLTRILEQLNAEESVLCSCGHSRQEHAFRSGICRTGEVTGLTPEGIPETKDCECQRFCTPK